MPNAHMLKSHMESEMDMLNQTVHMGRTLLLNNYSVLLNRSLYDVTYTVNKDMLDVIHKMCQDTADDDTKMNICAKYTHVVDTLYTNDTSEMSVTFGDRFVPYSMLSCLAVLFNILSIGVMLQIRSPHWSCHHMLLMNLALSDIVGTILLWMYHNSPALFPWFTVTTLSHCVFISLVLVAPFILTLCNSSCNLLLLAVNLYLAICHPLLSIRSTSVIRIMMVVIWLCSLTLASVPLIIMLFTNHSDDCAKYATDMGVKSLEICAYVLIAVIVIAIVLYMRIYHVILHYKRCGALHVHRHHQQQGGSTRDRNYKAFLTTLLLAGSLFIFWLPYMTFHFITAHLDIDAIPDVVLHIKFYFIDFLPVLHFLTDPAIYGLRITEIRRGYRKLLCHFITKPRQQQQHRSSMETRMTLLRYCGHRNSESTPL